MTVEDEVAEILSKWLEHNRLNWHIDWGTHDTSRPEIVRNNDISMYGIIGRIHGSTVKFAHRTFPSYVEINIANPKFFDKIEEMLKRIEEIDDI